MSSVSAVRAMPVSFSWSLPSFSGISSNRLTKLFHNTALPQTTLPLAEGKAVSLSNLWGGPFNVFMTGLWGILWAEAFGQLVFGGVRVHQQFNPVQENRWVTVKELCIKGVSFTGLTANIATWANDIEAIALGAAVSGVRMLGFGASCITGSAYAYKSFQEILELRERVSQTNDPVECAHLKQKILLSCLELAAHSTGVIWAFLSFWALALTITLPAILMTSLVTISCVLAVSSIFYRIYLSKMHPATIPAPA